MSFYWPKQFYRRGGTLGQWQNARTGQRFKIGGFPNGLAVRELKNLVEKHKQSYLVIRVSGPTHFAGLHQACAWMSEVGSSMLASCACSICVARKVTVGFELADRGVLNVIVFHTLGRQRLRKPPDN